mmetsp:Transcript_18558/g.33628  ORF Transcript_18558/g.33628 Transcript_18558/m.33628 type:complete len:426 (-) Transcript_18558:181-1458(-)|eukprot:CAMPEP_0198291594 /NCGR_PEP_ID=MMETSP1449-20131203/9076_1 /TAXON_ID=420275 /ORGANISM="Attheya septentrionalis, Strain CCMP2084" /LENGTH=425 /DNA_ID=CAMNT_0043990259 /DNA_START=213 /DNA_END=1490 /DNA_ORIENTATION=+
MKFLFLLGCTVGSSLAFVPSSPPHHSFGTSATVAAVAGSQQHGQTYQDLKQQTRKTVLSLQRNPDENELEQFVKQSVKAFSTLSIAMVLSSSVLFGANAVEDTGKYDGFAEYAKENKMEQSDVGCFVKKCGDQTKALFSNPRGIKGVSCLGRCKGEQSCATRCFAEYGSEDLNNWLSCTIEENECVKVPKNVDNSAENAGYTTALKNFDPKTLEGKWYKTDGLNPNYDLFDCQTNTFQPSSGGDKNDYSEVDMGIFFRVLQPQEAGGGYWENSLTEHMVVDAVVDPKNPSGRTMHTEGQMYGLKFNENWYIIGESDGKGDVPPFKLVAYKGHTLQGNYEGAFVYSRESKLPAAAMPAVKAAAAKAGLDFDKFTRIDNTCSIATASLNDASAGTGTSTTDWVDLVVGEGGVIDWVVPGWRGEYKAK